MKKISINKKRVYVWYLGWSGMQKRLIIIDRLDSCLRLNNWSDPDVGQLCITENGHLDVLKKKWLQRSTSPVFKPSMRYSFKHSKVVGHDCYFVNVEKGHEFTFRGKKFTHVTQKEDI